MSSIVGGYVERLHTALSVFPDELASQLITLTRHRLLDSPHGDQPGWSAALESLPQVPASLVMDRDTVALEGDAGVSRETLVESLQQLHPWRKGPFDFFSVSVDTEWRSDWKWQRLAPHLDDLNGRRVLDVGCGSGYHCWRMRGAGADFVLGIDPTILFLFQFLAIKRYQWEQPVWMAPVRMEEMPRSTWFDTVFSMGVLYHRRSPLDHIEELIGALRPGGQLVLETLVVPGDASTVLFPEDRYARMRNVFFLPSSALLLRWCERLGLQDVSLVDETPTTLEEQRATPWMRFQSLADFLDPDDATRTIEGYPAPRRATVTARRR